jgi:hypothetical protein
MPVTPTKKRKPNASSKITTRPPHNLPKTAIPLAGLGKWYYHLQNIIGLWWSPTKARRRPLEQPCHDHHLLALLRNAQLRDLLGGHANQITEPPAAASARDAATGLGTGAGAGQLQPDEARAVEAWRPLRWRDRRARSRPGLSRPSTGHRTSAGVSRAASTGLARCGQDALVVCCRRARLARSRPRRCRVLSSAQQWLS